MWQPMHGLGHHILGFWHTSRLLLDASSVCYTAVCVLGRHGGWLPIAHMLPQLLAVCIISTEELYHCWRVPVGFCLYGHVQLQAQQAADKPPEIIRVPELMGHGESNPFYVTKHVRVMPIPPAPRPQHVTDNLH